MMQSKLSDIELITKTMAGNQSAYAELIKRHQRFVFTLAMRFTKSREDAEEVAQDCFIKAYRSLDSFKKESKFSTWLYTIVYTTAMTSLRKKRLDTASIDDEGTHIQIENTPSAMTLIMPRTSQGRFTLTRLLNNYLPMMRQL